MNRILLFFKKSKNYFVLVCVFFSITTLCSSIIQLTVQDKQYDSNIHILLRGFLCLLCSSFIVVFKFIKFKNKFIQEVAHFTISLSIILLFIFCMSFFVEIGGEHPYLILSLNYAAIYFIITIFTYIKNRIKKN